MLLPGSLGPLLRTWGAAYADPQVPMDLLEATCAKAPPNRLVQVLYLGYSTSMRHGGQG